MRSRRLAILSSTAATVAGALLLAGCGGSSSPSSASTTGGPTTSQTVAYAHCMRSHGVPTFPDPTSGGEIPKAQVVSASKSNPSQFESANSACRHLLPSGGNGETPAQITQDWGQFRQFAHCMRHHGVPNWPDPTNRSTTDRRPAFNITAIGLNGNSPPLRAKAQQCASLVHLNGLPAAH
jgi:hypothetical protein